MKNDSLIAALLLGTALCAQAQAGDVMADKAQLDSFYDGLATHAVGKAPGAGSQLKGLAGGLSADWKGPHDGPVRPEVEKSEDARPVRPAFDPHYEAPRTTTQEPVESMAIEYKVGLWILAVLSAVVLLALVL